MRIKKITALLLICFSMVAIGPVYAAGDDGASGLKTIYSASQETVNSELFFGNKGQATSEYVTVFPTKESTAKLKGDRPFEIVTSIAGGVLLFNPISNFWMNFFQPNLLSAVLIVGPWSVITSYIAGRETLGRVGTLADDKVFGEGKGPRFVLEPTSYTKFTYSKKEQWVTYEGWVKASTDVWTKTPAIDANDIKVGEYYYIKTKTWLFNDLSSGQANIKEALTLYEGLRVKVLEIKEIPEKKTLSDRLFSGTLESGKWIKVETPKLNYNKYIKGEKDAIEGSQL